MFAELRRGARLKQHRLRLSFVVAHSGALGSRHLTQGCAELLERRRFCSELTRRGGRRNPSVGANSPTRGGLAGLPSSGSGKKQMLLVHRAKSSNGDNSNPRISQMRMQNPLLLSRQTMLTMKQMLPTVKVTAPMSRTFMRSRNLVLSRWSLYSLVQQ
jgi:hypothetical protein